MPRQLCLFICYSIWSLYLSAFVKAECYHPGGEIFKRKFFVGEFNLPFRIEVSQRISHRLVSNIAKILLQEVMGYEHVLLMEQDTENITRTLQKLSTCDNPDKPETSCQMVDETGPELMINLELWLPPAYNLEKWINTHRIEDCGPLGPIGRSGWFIENRIVDLFWRENSTIINNYRAFLNSEITRYFDLSSDEYVIDKANHTCSTLPKPKDLDCGKDGFYRPPQCNNRHINCATILSDYPGSTFEILEKIILRYGLYVNVAWLGNDFENALLRMLRDQKASERRNIIFFHKKPMMLSSLQEFTHVAFPGCEDDLLISGPGPTECIFEVNQLQKVVWSEIKASAPHAFELLRAMNFSQKQYSQILSSYIKGINRGSDFYNVSCAWVRENVMVWQQWVPVDAHEKNTLHIGGIFPLDGVYWKQGAVLEAARMAIDAINNNNSLLPNHNLNLLDRDGHCATDQVMRSFINYIKSDTFKTMVGILGPACSDTVEPIAGVAKHFDTIIISYSAEGTLFNRQEQYPFFFRTIPENNIFRYVFLKLFKKLGYTRIAALTEEGQKYPEYLSYLQTLMEANKMTFIVNRKFPRESVFTDLSSHLEDLKSKGAKIIIGDFYEYAARSVMCTAYKMRMTAANGYVWFLPAWYQSDWYDTDRKNDEVYSNEKVPCTTEEMVSAINGHMSLSYRFYADPYSITQENKTVKEWKEAYNSTTARQNKVPSSYGGYTYDAVWVYALALDILFRENESHVATLHTTRTSRRLVELIRETNFHGVTGHVYFQNGSRLSDVMVWQWLNNSRRMIGIYRTTSSESGELELNETNIRWLTANGRKPEDGRSFDSEHCGAVEALRSFFKLKCDTAKTVANIIGISAFVVVILVLIVIFKRRYDKRMAITEQRMKELGLLSNGVPFALDEWEMPRGNIVINRKIGEGAFGAVFGGEALVKNKGWIAVAVKTLKNNAKTEEKLDFLSEAETMKKFDHVNIVKLVGVCTTGEPVYTIMEFMLYGDLKTYLLSRRNMAVDETFRSQSDEVSNRRLTGMALDIARGLSYLADKKYVHRDIACRNCLVNTFRSVKIGDFGMCRRMFDHDYYRHNKKGMLPIRWMAPESLIDGLFTPMSDVWSYGVVLYEIITFASFPYQGLSHEQVLNHLRNHKTLPVPKGCKPELEDLLLRCWASDPQHRPKAAEIVEILALNPELITPCLDVPTASVASEDPDALREVIVVGGRAHSFSSVWQSRTAPRASTQHDHLSILDPSQLLQIAPDIAHAGRFSGFRNPLKRSLHESFKKTKRDMSRDRPVDNLPQSTYL